MTTSRTTDTSAALGRIAVFAALIVVLGTVIVPLPSGVPITAQTLGVMLAGLVLGPRLAPLAVVLVLALAATLFTVLFGFLMASACGYLAGLLGSSSSPISGIGILTTMATALLLPLVLGASTGPEGDRFVTGMALLLT